MSESLNLKQSENGVLLHVKANAGARRNAVTGIHNGDLKVSVTQVAEKGKANKAIIKLLANWLQISPRQLQLLSGHSTSKKLFLIRNVDIDAIADRIDTLT